MLGGQAGWYSSGLNPGSISRSGGTRQDSTGDLRLRTGVQVKKKTPTSPSAAFLGVNLRCARLLCLLPYSVSPILLPEVPLFPLLTPNRGHGRTNPRHGRSVTPVWRVGINFFRSCKRPTFLRQCPPHHAARRTAAYTQPCAVSLPEPACINARIDFRGGGQVRRIVRDITWLLLIAAESGWHPKPSLNTHQIIYYTERAVIIGVATAFKVVNLPLPFMNHYSISPSVPPIIFLCT